MTAVSRKTQAKRFMEEFLQRYGVTKQDQTYRNTHVVIVPPNRLGLGYMEIRSRMLGSWSADFSLSTPPHLCHVQERTVPVIAEAGEELPVGSMTIDVDDIGEGRPYQITYVDPRRRKPGSRNALRIEEHTPFQHCLLLPLTKRAKTLVKRGNIMMKPEYFDDFGYCRCEGNECRSCPIPPQFSLELFAYDVDL